MRALPIVFASLLVASLATVPASVAAAPTAAAPDPRAGARVAKSCGPEFTKVVSKPIKEVGTGARVGALVVNVRTGSKPGYCGDAVFTGRYASDHYATTLFMITDDYSGQHYESTYSPNPDPEAICLSTAAVRTGQKLRLQVRVFVDDHQDTPAVAKAAVRVKVTTTPTIETPDRSRPQVRCYEQEIY